MKQIITRGQILDVPDNFAELSAKEQDDYIDAQLGPIEKSQPVSQVEDVGKVFGKWFG